ncbi:hypothetical protein QBC34DRAFT_427817 [Podospora aff. communis PSN243]|uniref:EF-hand domain-containing protein n=1 Tax=Podospora aff. communis PSN243 TaxID=3040156 RepID=A0AAV9GF64_9PEZI|nr:hypothetical protein QBC34DRAFT_427817 [Podospora aff. communis PSN243]
MGEQEIKYYITRFVTRTKSYCHAGGERENGAQASIYMLSGVVGVEEAEAAVGDGSQKSELHAKNPSIPTASLGFSGRRVRGWMREAGHEAELLALREALISGESGYSRPDDGPMPDALHVISLLPAWKKASLVLFLACSFLFSFNKHSDSNHEHPDPMDSNHDPANTMESPPDPPDGPLAGFFTGLWQLILTLQRGLHQSQFMSALESAMESAMKAAMIRRKKNWSNVECRRRRWRIRERRSDDNGDKIQALREGRDRHRPFLEPIAPTHTHMQHRLNTLRLRIQAWSESVLGEAAQIPAHEVTSAAEGYRLPGLVAAFKNICCKATLDSRHLERSQLLLVDIVRGITAKILFDLAVCHPLGPCAKPARDRFSALFDTTSIGPDFKLQHNKAAKAWEAVCLNMYHSSHPVADTLGSAQDRAVAARRHMFWITVTINEALLPVLDAALPRGGHKLRPTKDSGPEEVQVTSALNDIVAEAMDIGRVLGQLCAGRVAMDKAWFEENADKDGFISPSEMGERIEARFSSKAGKLRESAKARAGIVLFPGLLKYGDEYGQNWDHWTVWGSAEVQLFAD